MLNWQHEVCKRWAPWERKKKNLFLAYAFVVAVGVGLGTVAVVGTGAGGIVAAVAAAAVAVVAACFPSSVVQNHLGDVSYQSHPPDVHCYDPSKKTTTTSCCF